MKKYSYTIYAVPDVISRIHADHSGIVGEWNSESVIFEHESDLTMVLNAFCEKYPEVEMHFIKKTPDGRVFYYKNAEGKLAISDGDFPHNTVFKKNNNK